MPTVALIYVDNYDELNADQQFHRNAVLAEVERLVSEFVTGIEGTYRRYENARFFVVFEAKRIAELEKQRFSLLDAVRGIETGTEQQVTLSIAVGVETASPRRMNPRGRAWSLRSAGAATRRLLSAAHSMRFMAASGRLQQPSNPA